MSRWDNFFDEETAPLENGSINSGMESGKMINVSMENGEVVNGSMESGEVVNDSMESGKMEIGEMVPVKTWQMTDDPKDYVELWTDTARSEIIDLKGFEKMEDIPKDEDTDYKVCGDAEEDGLAWRFDEDMKTAMGHTFGAVYERLNGYEVNFKFDVLEEYISQIHRSCTVIASSIQQQWVNESIARIAYCLSENGCVIALVSDNQWRKITGEKIKPYFDSGIRAVWITGLDGGKVILNDFASKKGRQMTVAKEDFCGLTGELLEVYK